MQPPTRSTMAGGTRAHAKCVILLVAAATACAAMDGVYNMPDMKPLLHDSSKGRLKLRTVCPATYRSLDGSCTNARQKLAGVSGTPLHNYASDTFDAAGRATSGLKSARDVSNIVSHQADVVSFDPDIRLSEFVTFFGQFVDHSIVGTSADSTSTNMTIPVRFDDPIVSDTPGRRLAFQRSVKAGFSNGSRWKRPVNCVSSALDLFGVYGKGPHAQRLRLKARGKMKVLSHGRHGDLLPLNDKSIAFGLNAPEVTRGKGLEAQFFAAGDHRSNENPILTAIHTLFMREHNRIATELRSAFPDANDETLYRMARTVNIARFQRIVYEEYLPAMTGKKLPACRRANNCYVSSTDPSVSDVFSTAAFRVGHSMVGPVINMVNAALVQSSVRISDMFFPRKAGVLRSGIEDFLRGAVWHQAQKIDTRVTSELRNHLFNGVEHEDGVDLVALNLQRSRDHRIQPYVALRKFFTGKRVHRWTDITRDGPTIRALQKAYGRLGKVEAWVGLMAEDHPPGSPMGATCREIWLREFQRLRDGDRFFYRNVAAYDRKLWNGYKAIRDIANNVGGYSMKKLILDNSKIRPAQLPGTNVPWIAPSP